MGMGNRRQGMPQTAGYEGAIDQFAPPPAPSRRFGLPQEFQFGTPDFQQPGQPPRGRFSSPPAGIDTGIRQPG